MHSHSFTPLIPRLLARICGRPMRQAALPLRLYSVSATVDTETVTSLRHDLMATCGDKLESMRIEACDHGRRMKVRLQIASTGADGLIDAVMRRLYG